MSSLLSPPPVEGNSAPRESTMQVSLELAEAKLILTRARIRNVPTMTDTVRATPKPFGWML